MRFTFIPFYQAKDYEGVIVVDSYLPNCLTFSHWPGAPKITGVHDDTSTGIVLNTLKHRPELLNGNRYITNNHFDVDGFLGIWSLRNPEKALQCEGLLRKMAILGDFREINLESAEDHQALQLVCWINAVEARQFYAPFGNKEIGASELFGCVPKYTYFLETFEEMMQVPERGKEYWEEEYSEVLQGMEVLASAKSRRWLDDSLRLQVIDTPEPLHYYALFAKSKEADMVLSRYADGRYELEYKYTSWVDTATRFSYPRIDMQPLANRLSMLEAAPQRWFAEKITDTAPILRLNGEKMSKEQRYASPHKRLINSSGITPDVLLSEIQQFYRKAYQGVSQKTDWNWLELRDLNKNILDKLS